MEVLQGPSSGSMVSNLDLNMLDDLEAMGKPGSEAWKAKKQDLIVRLRKAKDRQKLLSHQLALQQERCKLMRQEKENYKLEEEIRRTEERTLCEESDRIRQERWESTMAKLQRDREDRELRFKIEQEELRAALEEKQALLEQQVDLDRIRNEVGLGNGNSGGIPVRLEQERVDQVQRGENLNLDAGRMVTDRVEQWVQGVNNGPIDKGHSQFGNVFTQQCSEAAMAAGHSHANSQGGVNTSGTCLLSELGLNEKTVRFINEQAGRAKVGQSEVVTANAGQVNNGALPVVVSGMNVQHLSADRAPGPGNVEQGDGLPASGIVGLAEQNVNAGSNGECSSVSTTKIKKKKSGMLA